MARRSLFALFALVATLAFAAAGCGGGGDEDVPDDAVAVVDGDKVTRTSYEALVSQARKTFQDQKREFPKAGTAERKQLTDQAVEFLVQRQQFEQEAANLGIEVTDKDVDNRLKQIKQQYFGGDEKKYEKQLKDQGLTDAQVRNDVRAQVVSEKLFNQVTKDVKVTDADVNKYYRDNMEQYSTPEQREVRHILVKTRAQANRIYDQLKDGGNFAALAKQHSQDPSSKDNGGKITISKGQTVAPFDQTAFLLKRNVISRPVKTEYGYHLIQPVSEVKAATTRPLNKALRNQIRPQLLQQRREEAMNTWVQGLGKQYESKISYATGFAPAAAAGAESGTTSGSDDE
jgi:parvulin-like peptidyl-prolyl isomerase